MADEKAEIQISTATDTGTTAPVATKQGVSNRPKRARQSTNTDPGPKAVKSSSSGQRKYSPDERLEKLKQIDALMSDGGSTLKDAVKKIGISDETYYNWKRATLTVEPPSEAPVPASDELEDLIRLEQENQHLRKLLAEKLRAENLELRRRLGLN